MTPNSHLCKCGVYNKGFQKGKLEERKRIEEIIENWKFRTTLTYDEDSIRQTEIVNKIIESVKQLQKEIVEED